MVMIVPVSDGLSCNKSRDGVTVSTSASEAEDGGSIPSPATI